MPASYMGRVQVLTAPLSSQLLAKAHGKAMEDGPIPRVSAAIRDTQTFSDS